ncbi:hypothetical protein BD410DRAFT_793263 [Rickenella mellea]|uniref:Uncharacterized protein n=1 Tax=Rickenella mellea TaxID=50990 RepID=A0A4Y7PU40_9AGAM|nr:hypothetical protein BD410DRAFT_793263 [Rickenella mellea]
MVDFQSRKVQHTSPIYLIPSDIAFHIFDYCLPQEEFPRPSIRSAPLQLSLVCQSWRKWVIATPWLWRKILLCTREFESPEGGRMSIPESSLDAMALEVWMKRASALTMSVQIRYTIAASVPHTTHILETDSPRVFRVIVENPTRWKDLRLCLPSADLYWGCTVIQRNVPNLELFEVNDASIPAFNETPVRLDPRVAGTLCTLLIHASVTYKHPDASCTPFVRLRTLSVKHTYPWECLHLLKYCPVLEDLSLHFHDLTEKAIPFVYPTITLPSLQNFYLAHTGTLENGGSVYPQTPYDVEIGQLLDHLNLPNLRGFYLWMAVQGFARYSSDYYSDELEWDYLSRLITRSNCSLSKLELRSPYLDTTSIMNSLRLSPHLSYLGIPADEDLERDIPQMFPNLDSLRIFNEDTGSND